MHIYITDLLVFDRHAVELEKQKQTYVAAEKVRRERWRAEETQRIKEATVKSLEPEIQRIIGRGKAEIQKLKAVHEVSKSTCNTLFISTRLIYYFSPSNFTAYLYFLLFYIIFSNTCACNYIKTS